MTSSAEALASRRDLSRKAVRGAAWTAAGTWVAQGLQFSIFVLLSRLLGPEAYGLIALAMIVTMAADVFVSQGGWGEGLIRDPALDQRRMSAVFWLLMGMAALFMVLACAAAPVLAHLYAEPALLWLMPSLALALPFNAAAVVPAALLRRELRLKALTMRTSAGIAVAGAAAVALAASGAGVVSLVVFQVAQPVVQLGVLLLLSQWRPGRPGSLRDAGDTARFAAGMTGERIMLLIDALLLRTLVARWLGLGMLGQLSLALKIRELAIVQLTRPVRVTLIPSAVRLRDQPDALVTLLHRTMRLSTLAAWPTAVGLSLLAADLVPLLFGEQWRGAVPAVEMLASVIGFVAIGQIAGALISFAGRTRLLAALALLSTLTLLVGLLLIWPSDLRELGIVLVLRVLVPLPFKLWCAGRVTRLPVFAASLRIWPVVASAALMALAMVGSRHLLVDAEPLLRLAATAAAGGLAYGLGILLLARQALADLRSALNLLRR